MLLIKTVLLRPYVFLFLGVSLFSASRFLGWKRTRVMFGITWVTAFTCEFLSTRVGFPFGDYFYTASTVGEELYISNIPFMDSLSFTFLLYASYCLALLFTLPSHSHPHPSKPCRHLVLQNLVSWPVIALTCLFFMFIDIVIDPVALRGDRWFLGQIYGYPDPGVYFGVPLANFIGWFIVGLIAMIGYRVVDQRKGVFPDLPSTIPVRVVLLGCGLYYMVLLFNLFVTFWIGEVLMGMVGCFIYAPITILVWLKFAGRLSISQNT